MPEESITALLEAHRLGQEHALDRAFEIVYDELRRLARHQLRGQGDGKTLNTTSLVHELYLKVAAADNPSVEDRGHFMALASRAMRQVIVDHARARSRSKRGGDVRQVPVDTDLHGITDDAEWILVVDEALDQIRMVNERLGDVFECRFFGGLSEQESAEALGVSLRTVQRDWQRAKTWLQKFLADGE